MVFNLCIRQVSTDFLGDPGIFLELLFGLRLLLLAPIENLLVEHFAAHQVSTGLENVRVNVL